MKLRNELRDHFKRYVGRIQQKIKPQNETKQIEVWSKIDGNQS